MTEKIKNSTMQKQDSEKGAALPDFATLEQTLKERFSSTADLKFRHAVVLNKQRILIVFLGTLAEKSEFIDEILRNYHELRYNRLKEKFSDVVKYSVEQVMSSSETAECANLEECISFILRGDCIIFFDGADKAIAASIKGYGGRPISEPPTAASIRGPREGFTEDFKTNLMLLRKRIHSENLVFEQIEVGRLTKTMVVVCYIKNVASPELVDRIREKIRSIDIDAINDSSYIQKFLERNPYSLFKQVGTTEKSDVCAAKMMEGRIAVVVDNSPMVLTVPFLLYENFQSHEDYYGRKHKADYLRLLRILSVIMAISLPALHVAILMHEYHVAPVKYLISLNNATANVPIPPLIEMLLVLFLFDLLHEASVRMPRSIGLALNIVGALVLGDTAVKANILSSPSVIVGALSGIGLFAVPEQGASFSLLRIVFLLVSSLLGTFGLFFSLMLLILYFVGLDSYETPYLAPFAPLVPADLKDGLLRDEITDFTTRPKSIPNINPRRLKVKPKNSNGG